MSQQPPYGQPPPYAGPPRYVPPPPRRRSVRLLWWGAGVVAVVAVVALVLVLVLRGGDPPPQTPREATERFVAALDSGDCEELTPLVSARLAELLDCGSGSTASAALSGISVLNVTFGDIEVLEESEEEAQVSVDLRVMSVEAAAVLALIHEDDGWVVDDLDLDGSRIPLPGLP